MRTDHELLQSVTRFVTVCEVGASTRPCYDRIKSCQGLDQIILLLDFIDLGDCNKK